MGIEELFMTTDFDLQGIVKVEIFALHLFSRFSRLQYAAQKNVYLHKGAGSAQLLVGRGRSN